jgi:hypothetical protein
MQFYNKSHSTQPKFDTTWAGGDTGKRPSGESTYVLLLGASVCIRISALATCEYGNELSGSINAGKFLTNCKTS